MGEKWIDRSWRDIITENVDDAILFFKPDIAADRDYSKKLMLIPTELPTIGGDSDKGMRISDICLSVPLITGVAQRLGLYIEQQHWLDFALALRMFQDYYRLSDRLQVPITSLAIFTGNINPIDRYTTECYGTELSFKYNVYHVASADVKALERNDNIFALAVLAGRRMLDAGGDPEKRGLYSLELLRLMKERGYDAKRARNLQKFVSRIFRLKDKDIDPKVKEVWSMEFIPIDEAIREIQIRDAMEEGMEKGLEKGLEKKAFEVARGMLADGLSLEFIGKYTGLGKEDILALS